VRGFNLNFIEYVIERHVGGFHRDFGLWLEYSWLFLVIIGLEGILSAALIGWFASSRDKQGESNPYGKQK